MALQFTVKPIIGQECICPDGMGRVVKFEDDFPRCTITVSTYIKDRQCNWDVHNVTLIHPTGEQEKVEILDFD